MSSVDDLVVRVLGPGGVIDELRTQLEGMMRRQNAGALTSLFFPSGDNGEPKGGLFFHVHVGGVTLTGQVFPCEALGDGWIAVGPPGDGKKKPVFVRVGAIDFVAGPFDANPAEPSRLAVPTNLPAPRR